jgi:GNAT superfamily N-acetyltransferase
MGFLMNNTIKYIAFVKLDSKILKDILELERLVFENPMGGLKITRELDSKYNVNIQMAYDGVKAVGYKIGFERSKRVFYSWGGGVHPDYRGLGIAKHMMMEQHEFAKSKSYKVVRTQTNNSFKPMLLLNLKSGFEIRGSMQSIGDNDLSIILEKEL